MATLSIGALLTVALGAPVEAHAVRDVCAMATSHLHHAAIDWTENGIPRWRRGERGASITSEPPAVQNAAGGRSLLRSSFLEITAFALGLGEEKAESRYLTDLGFQPAADGRFTNKMMIGQATRSTRMPCAIAGRWTTLPRCNKP